LGAQPIESRAEVKPAATTSHRTALVARTLIALYWWPGDATEEIMAATPDIDWVVISLKRTPERLELFQLINAQVGLRYEVLAAVDGMTVDPQRLIDQRLTVEGLDWKPGAIGAALSHLLCWERAVETGRAVGILEDDVFLRHDFLRSSEQVMGALPPDWDIIHLGFNTDSVFDLEIHPGCNVRGGFSVWFPTFEDCERFVVSTDPAVPVKMHNSFGNCCYVVSPSGARKLIDGCFPMSRRAIPIPTLKAMLLPASKDALMNEQYRTMAAYVSVPPIAVPINDKDQSTVGVR
jgi:glycosyl transferase, family 25